MRVTQRRSDLDVVRFLALISMFIAHVAPSPGPGRILELSEYVTMPLFALVIGAGAQLAHGRLAQTGDRRHWWLSLGVRVGALLGLGLLLEQAGAQVVIVLVHLAALALVAAVLAACPTSVVAGSGVAAFVVTPVLMREGLFFGADLDPAGRSAWIQNFLWAGEPYRLGSMIVYAALGIVLARRWLGSRPSLTPALVGTGATVLAIGLLAAEQLGRVDLVPYSGSAAETALDVCLAVGVMGLGLTLARVLPAGIARTLAATGAMTLSFYAIHIWFLAYDVRVLHPGMRDDSWLNLAVLVVGSVVIATGWRFAVRPEPWRRGPLEGPLAWLTAADHTATKVRHA